MATLCWRSTFSTSSVSSANGVSSASESFRYSALPLAATPAWSNQVEKRARVSGSNPRRISSSSTVSATWPAPSLPPSATFPAPAVPGDSST